MNNMLIKILQNIIVETENSTYLLKEDGGKFSCKDVIVELQEVNGKIDVYLKAKTTLVKRVHLKWNHKINPNSKILNDQWERSYGDLSWEIPDKALKNLPWYFLSNYSGTTECFGVKVQSNAMCFWNIDENQIGLCLDVRNGTHGVDLQGRCLLAAEIVSMSSQKNPFDVCCNFCKLMCDKTKKVDNPVYGNNNWYYAYGNSSYEQIIKDSKLLCKLTEGLENRPYMVIDDGWQINHMNPQGYNGGPWHSANAKFSNMKKLANEIKSYDLKPGIWYRPLQSLGEIASEYRMRNSNDLCDPSVPAIIEMVKADMERLISWGYKLIKHDFTTFDILGIWGAYMSNDITCGDWSFYNKTVTTAEVILNLYREIAKVADGKAIIIGCNTISHLSAGIFELYRTGDDTSGNDWTRTRKMGVNTLAFRMPQHKAFYEADADCVGMMGEIEWKQNRQWLDLLAHSGTPLFVSVDPDIVTDEQCEDLRCAYVLGSQQRNIAVPINWMETKTPSHWKSGDELLEYDWYTGSNEKK